MNWDILKHVKNPFDRLRDVTIALDVDDCSIYDSAPYTWTGTVGQEKVKIIQKDYPATRLEQFDFVDYPERLSFTKSDVVKFIDEYMGDMKD